jgi:hypothetical protein
MSYADLPPSISKPCANFERALPQGYAGFRQRGAADRTAPCMLEKFERVAQFNGFRERSGCAAPSSAPSPAAAIAAPRGAG